MKLDVFGFSVKPGHWCKFDDLWPRGYHRPRQHIFDVMIFYLQVSHTQVSVFTFVRVPYLPKAMASGTLANKNALK